MRSTVDSGGAELRVICGPTGAGKSALALSLAGRLPIAIISADSRQVYRGFDIGTAKPTRAEREAVPHFGIDVAEPDERFTAARWAGHVPAWLDEARSSGRTPVLVGGTGFYLRALFAPLFVEPELDESRRRDLRPLLRSLPAEEVRRWCEALDPSRAALGRAQWERAIEVALLSGRRITDLHADHRRATGLTARYLVVDPGAVLAPRLEQRTDEMLEAGWLDEVRALASRVPKDAKAWTATGYDALWQVVQGNRTLADATEEVVIRTRQYAKRQRTWFRHQLDAARVTRIDPLAPDAVDRAMAWFHGEGP